MRISKFRVQNYKGISDASLVLGKKPGTVHTLIGLNESGKTTLLEALSLFRPNQGGVDEVSRDPTLMEPGPHFVPKKDELTFTGAVSITATVHLNFDDLADLAAYCRDELELSLVAQKIPKSFEIKKKYNFEQSFYESEETIWDISFFDGDVDRPKKFGEEDWQKAVSFLGARLPTIVYFPNFLFDVPDRISLSGNNKTARDTYFSQVLNNVLGKIDSSLSLVDHVIEPTLALAEDRSFAEFQNVYQDSPIARRNEATFSKISRVVSKIIFEQWRKIQPDAPENMNFSVNFAITASLSKKELAELVPAGRRQEAINLGSVVNDKLDVSSGPPLLTCQFSIHDDQTDFRLNERSVGFRWFFCFFLFTFFYRQQRQSSYTVFLLDEPASNLHAGAQSRILDSFAAIANGTNDVVYSTHSHHLINPNWLEQAHIIANRRNAEEEELGGFSFTEQQTDVEVERYRTFVGKHAKDTLYYLPVLEAIDYQVAHLDMLKDAIIVEGKSDYYVLTWFKKEHFPDLQFDFIPGGGAGNVSALAGLMTGWGKAFVFLHDSDPAGKNEAQKLHKHLPIKREQTLGYADALGSSGKLTLESLFSDDAKQAVADFHGANGFKKALITSAFAESLNGGTTIELDQDTVDRFSMVFDALSKRLAKLSQN